VRDVSRRLAHEAKAGELGLLALDLLIIPEVVLLLVVALAVVVPLDVVVHVGGVELLSLGSVGDEVGGVVTLEATPR
jgi:hypothetical protein